MSENAPVPRSQDSSAKTLFNLNYFFQSQLYWGLID